MFYPEILSESFFKNTSKKDFAALAVSFAALLVDEDFDKIESFLKQELEILKRQDLIELRKYDLSDIYESPQREKNLERYGDNENTCFCCGKPVKKGLFIHLTTQGLAIDKEEDDLSPYGLESQGFFPIGKSCAKKFYDKFIFKDETK